MRKFTSIATRVLSLGLVLHEVLGDPQVRQGPQVPETLVHQTMLDQPFDVRLRVPGFARLFPEELDDVAVRVGDLE